MAFKINILSSRDILRAYALMERLMPGLELTQWISATSSAALRRTWFVARDGEGYIRGICHVAVRGEGDRRRQLEIPLVIAASLIERSNIEEALLAAAKAFALEEGCARIHLWTAMPANWATLVEYLERGPWDHGLLYDVDDNAGPDQPIRPVKM